ncbi:GatB/YqeY domain-containing protein [Henriciella litoralis]|uniref:GatB/YqeY domain-containing protein n=1 Tax=Henriciella litoralis TaxID=568102 RepID=UPI000A06AA90|nr:GatB/YqeY domain-containing protein [Henriciella litoralis]
MGQTDVSPTTKIRDRLIAALHSAESDDPQGVRARTLRLVQCAMRDRDVTARGEGNCSGCEEADIRKFLEIMVAQREISAREFDESGRIAEAEREREEMEILESFLPQPLQGEALEDAVDDVVNDLEASKLKDMGRCMAELQSRYPGRIETGPANKAVRRALG